MLYFEISLELTENFMPVTELFDALPDRAQMFALHRLLTTSTRASQLYTAPVHCTDLDAQSESGVSAINC